MNKKIKFGFGMFLVVLLNLSLVFAGVTSPYDKNHPLNVYPGEETTVKFSYQNLGNENDLNLVLEIVEGDEFVKLDSKEYTVPADSKLTIEVGFKIPRSYEVGESKSFRIKFSEVPSETGEGMVTLGLGTSIGFNIDVVEKPEGVSDGFSIWYLVIAVVVLLVIVFLVWKKRKNRIIQPEKE
jgi:hypothetical protein